MQQYTVDNRVYTVELSKGVVSITCVDLDTVRTYKFSGGIGVLEDKGQIDSVESLSMFINDCFVAGWKSIVVDSSTITLSSEIATKYTAAKKYVFVLAADSGNFKELFKSQQDKISKLEERVRLNEATIRSLIKIGDYVVLSDGRLVKQERCLRVHVYYNFSTKLYDILGENDISKKDVSFDGVCLDDVVYVVGALANYTICLYGIREILLSKLIPKRVMENISFCLYIVNSKLYDFSDVSEMLCQHFEIVGSYHEMFDLDDILKIKGVKMVMLDNEIRVSQPKKDATLIARNYKIFDGGALSEKMKSYNVVQYK